MSWQDAARLAFYLAAGSALGTVYFVLLLRTARLHAAQASASRIVPLYLVRIGTAVAVFWLIVQQGALPLLVALAGFLMTRMVFQRCVSVG